MDKKEIKWIKENWKEVIGILYNNVDEKDLFEVLLMDYDPCEGFFKVLQDIILINENWFASNISFKTKMALLREITGEQLCIYCGSKDLIYQEKEHEQKVTIICKMCNCKITDINVENPKF